MSTDGWDHTWWRVPGSFPAVSWLCGVRPACGVKVGVQCDPGRGAGSMKALKKEVSWHIQRPERKPTQLKHRAQRGEWAQVRMVHVLACSHRELEAKGRLQLCLLSTKTLLSTVLFSPDSSTLAKPNCSDFPEPQLLHLSSLCIQPAVPASLSPQLKNSTGLLSQRL